jgi:putative ABC transport system permease protein
VASLTVAEGVIDSRPVAIGGIDPMRWPELYDLGPVAGDVADLRSGGIAVVSTDRSLLGTDVTVELERSTIDVPVVAVVARSTGGFDAPAYFVDRAVLDGVVDGLLDTHVYVRTSPGVGLAEARAALLEEVGRTPGSFLSSRQQHLDSMGSEVRAFASFIDAMLYLAMLIALLGVANTMALAVSERSNEIGLLRAVGATRSEVRRIVLLEAGLLSSVAAVCGTAVAVVGTWAFITVAGGSDIPTVIIPWPRISVTVLGSAVLGTLAAAWPAWRVSRRPALELVSSVR